MEVTKTDKILATALSGLALGFFAVSAIVLVVGILSIVTTPLTW